MESCAAADIVLSRIPGIARFAESFVAGMAKPPMSFVTGTCWSGVAARAAGARVGSLRFTVCVAGFGGVFFGGIAVFVAAGLGVGLAGIFMPGILWPACLIESALAAESRCAFVFAGVCADSCNGQATIARTAAAIPMRRAVLLN
jgi:hypothetical protein